MKKRRGKTISGMVPLCGPCAVAVAALFFLFGCAAKIQVTGAAAPPAVEVDEALPLIDAEPDSAEFDKADRYNLALDHFVIARDYERRGEQEMAERLYGIAFDFWPGPGFLRKTLADRYMLRDDHEGALGLFFREGETLAGLTPDEKRTVTSIYLRLGDAVRAAEAIESLGNEMTEAEMHSLALLYKSTGRSERALGSFRRFFGSGEHPASVGIRLAQLSVGERNLAEAESLAVILRGAYPGNAEVVSLLGTVRYLSRDTVSAVALFNEALALDSLNEDALRTLAHINVVGNRYTEAVSYYRRLTAQKELGEPYRRGLALLLFHMKEYGEAEKRLDTLIAERDGKDRQGLQELHVYRGLIRSQNKMHDRAAEDFRAAIAIDSLNEDAWKELCYMYMSAKDKDKAHAAVEQYAAVFPETATAWRFRGYVLNMREEYEGAIAALGNAVRADPADYYAWFQLGSILERRKRIDEAADAFRAALRIRPNDAQTVNYLGYMWADADMRLDSAKVLIEAALRAEPKNGAYLDSYAWVFYRMGDYEKALRYMNEAFETVKDDPSFKDDPVPYEHLGDICFELKDYKAAESAYKRSLELKTEDARRIKERLAEIRNLMRKKGN